MPTYPFKDLPNKFSKLMKNGKVSAALRLLDDENSGGVLHLTPDNLSKLKQKHPAAKLPNPPVLLEGEIQSVDPSLYSNIDESTISKAAIRTKGTSGPSGLDADGWKRILVSNNFGKQGAELRNSVAKMARTLCTREVVVNHDSNNQPYTDIEAYIACRLIPLDKNPGIRPIGIGEVLRRIIGKAIIFVIRPEIMESAGNLQLCAGQKSGCEAAVHAMSELFKEEETDALLLVDASNAFNTLNREVLLHNMPYICPAMSTYVRNCYCTPLRLFILGGSELHSTEGTTQGDPFAMPVYAVGLTTLLPLIKSTIEVKHVAYADDLGGLGKLIEIRSWWDNVCKFGPLLGYYPEPSKSWLIVKEELAADAMQIFHDTEIKITIEGRKYLGGFVGKPEARYQYAQELVSKWIKEIKILSKIAKCEPQTAYPAFVGGYQHKLTYHIQTSENLSEHLKPLDDITTS